jgi:hypothetical protein
MGSRQRVEWLQAVADLMLAQRDALAAKDAEGFLELTDRLQVLCQHAPPTLDSPPDPLERAWLRNLARINRSNARLLLALGEPLRELDSLARDRNLAVALDCCA